MGRDFARIIIAYVIAVGAATACLYVLEDLSTLWRAAAADVAATLVIFVFARAHDNSSFYDAYWSVAPPVLVCYWWAVHGDGGLRVVVLAVLILLWSVRLTHNWARGWAGLRHQDWRYADLQASAGRWYPLVDLFGIQLLPTVLVFLGCVPVWLMLQGAAAPWGVLDWVWAIVGFAALGLESRADGVLRRFRLDERNRGRVLREDVWAWCRHPNYLGELGFWFALAVAGFSATGDWFSWIGIVGMVLLFVFVSIPMIEKRQISNKPDYEVYKTEVAMLLPFLKR